MIIERRYFIGAAIAAASAPRILADSPWGGPVLDIHLHPRGPEGKELDHVIGTGCEKAVLLTNRNTEDKAKAAMRLNPGRFARFAAGDLNQPDTLGRLRASVKDGAIGFGEFKWAGAVDAPEARRLYELAADLRVPVLIHFEENSNSFSGFRRLPDVLKAFKRTTFIGHANSWWAHISAEVDDSIGYPTGRVKPGGLIDKMLADYPNIYGDLSANSGRNALARDPGFAAGFIERHRSKLMFGSDCACQNGNGVGQRQKRLAGKCTGRETLTLLKGMASPESFRRITWENGTKLLRIPLG